MTNRKLVVAFDFFSLCFIGVLSKQKFIELPTEVLIICWLTDRYLLDHIYKACFLLQTEQHFFDLGN